MFFFVEKCRICGKKGMSKYLNFGQMPLANNLVKQKSTETDHFFPLEVCFCTNCFLSQLSVVVDPKTLFSNYSYRTSISSTFRNHFAEMADTMKRFFPDVKNCLALDIASNDGCLLQEFKKKGFEVLGVEPAKNIAEIAEKEGIKTITEFWGESAAKKVLGKKTKPKIVTATNVFAHVDDIHSFVSNVKKVLSKDGVFIIEVPYALNLVEKKEFDTIYHEHLSYFLVKPLLKFFEIQKMTVFDIADISVHGGSIRVFAKFPDNDKIKVREENIERFLLKEKERNLYDARTYHEFSLEVLAAKIRFLELLLKLKKDGKKIAGYGAAAKASTLLNYCRISPEQVEFIADDSPLKQGMAFAGNRIPIVPSTEIEKQKPDYLVLFAWTIAKELVSKTKAYQSMGKYIIPLPSARIVSNEKEL